LEGSLRERVRWSSLVDWPVYPRLRRTMRASSCSSNADRRNPPNAASPSRSARNHAPLATPVERRACDIPSAARIRGPGEGEERCLRVGVSTGGPRSLRWARLASTRLSLTPAHIERPLERGQGWQQFAAELMANSKSFWLAEACRDRGSLAASRSRTSATSPALTGAAGRASIAAASPVCMLVSPRFRYRSSIRRTAGSRPCADEGAKQTLLDTLPNLDDHRFRGRV
jgi:hypothetical protein